MTQLINGQAEANLLCSQESCGSHLTVDRHENPLSCDPPMRTGVGANPARGTTPGGASNRRHKVDPPGGDHQALALLELPHKRELLPEQQQQFQGQQSRHRQPPTTPNNLHTYAFTVTSSVAASHSQLRKSKSIDNNNDRTTNNGKNDHGGNNSNPNKR